MCACDAFEESYRQIERSACDSTTDTFRGYGRRKITWNESVVSRVWKISVNDLHPPRKCLNINFQGDWSRVWCHRGNQVRFNWKHTLAIGLFRLLGRWWRNTLHNSAPNPAHCVSVSSWGQSYRAKWIWNVYILHWSQICTYIVIQTREGTQKRQMTDSNFIWGASCRT